MNVSFVGVVGTELLAGLDGVAASTGSACHSGSVELSPGPMGVTKRVGMGAVRFSLGRTTAEAELDAVVDQLRIAKARSAGGQAQLGRSSSDGFLPETTIIKDLV
ncbi:hypothetical protein [Rhizobium leguminosarum]|uniref:hypothetical protein n=1 Tax=Rhizobium leguminosarum TaxID=384 RepID=UPI001980AF16|nr:hypothetical protein [Rhizobium leguminosarum]